MMLKKYLVSSSGHTYNTLVRVNSLYVSKRNCENIWVSVREAWKHGLCENRNSDECECGKEMLFVSGYGCVRTNCEKASAGFVCVRERGRARKLWEVRHVSASVEPTSVCSAAYCVCVSDSTLRSYPHGGGIVFITNAMIHHTANEKQQAGPEQASPLCTL